MSGKRFQFHYEQLEPPTDRARVFSDPKQKRARKLRRHFFVFVCGLAIWITAFFQFVQPTSFGPVTRSAQGLLPLAAAPSAPLFVQDANVFAASAAEPRCNEANPPFAAMADESRLNRVFAHLPTALDWAHLSLEQSCDLIDVLVTDWITIVETFDGFAVEVVSSDTRMPARDFVSAAEHPVKIMSRIQVQQRLQDSKTSSKLENTQVRAALVSELRLALEKIAADGACLDFAQFAEVEPAVSKHFFEDFRAAMNTGGFQSCMIISGTGEDWRKSWVTDGFQDVVLKMFYEPWVGSAPTPLSENEWFSELAREATDLIGSDRLVLALGTFAAQWEAGRPLPEKLSYSEVMSQLADTGDALEFSPDFSGSVAVSASPDGKRRIVWLQDASTAFNQVSLLQEFGPVSLGVWSLGQEDPGLWQVLSQGVGGGGSDIPYLSSVRLDNYVDYVGEGPALSIQRKSQVGLRSFEVDPNTGLIVRQDYAAYPTPYRIERYARPTSNELILTFDDGPHPDFTPEILRILADTDTPAVFFALGQNVMKHPNILRDALDAGHEVGAHTFSHPRMDKISTSRARLEHNLTDRTIASAIGRSTVLYREPFLRSNGPIDARRIAPLEQVQERGQINFGMEIVPKDWMGLSANEISDYVITQVEQGAGNVILLHDGGSDDRSASVAALPRIITELRDKGYVFSSVSDVLGLSRDELMPPAEGFQPLFDRVSFGFASSTLSGIVLLFWVVLLIGLLRSGVILLLAVSRRRHRAPQIGPHPKVAVIIPAYNEQTAIAKTIESVLASDYPWLEVVVVDDGSTDNTLNEVLSFSFERNLRLISHPNQGKWSALNRALQDLEADVAVCIDADTQVAPNAISRLAEHFQNPRVGAVAGKIAVGNPVNILTRMQSLEYVTAQNFERRAFDRINGILVVPGAIGAWRVSALRKAGFFSPETMTEDCDMTISINRAGYRVVYDERAVAYTEAPQTLRALMAQRLRWSLGMFQCAWKHKRSIREGRSIGYVSIPDMAVFGYLFPLLAPIADLFVVILLINFFMGSWSGDIGAGNPILSPDLVWAYLSLPAIEFVIAAVAVMMDRTAKKSLILIWPFQRIFYRPILYLTVLRAVLRALSGTLAVWGKSKRYGGNLIQKGNPV